MPYPDCWSEELSKPYTSIVSEKEALDFADTLFSFGYTVPEITEEPSMSDYTIEDLVLFKRYYAMLKGKHDIQDIIQTLTGQPTKPTEKMMRGWTDAGT